MRIPGNIVLTVTIIAGFSAASRGSDTEPRAMALGGAYTAMARGPEAVAWNPANLGLRTSPRFKWQLLGGGVTFATENNAFSVKTYNDNFTAGDPACREGAWLGRSCFLNDADKAALLADVPGRGLKFNVDLEPMLALGIPLNGGVAFPLPWGLHGAVTTGLAFGLEGEAPKDMIELMLFGNEFDRQYDIAGWDGSAWGLGSLNFAAARPWMPKLLAPYLDEFSVGATIEFLGGSYAEVQRSDGGFLARREGTKIDSAYAITRVGGGTGYGLDFGVAGVTKDRKTTISMGMLNLLDTISWSGVGQTSIVWRLTERYLPELAERIMKRDLPESVTDIDARQDSFVVVASDLRLTRALDEDVAGIEDVLENEDVDGDGDKDFHIKLNDDSLSRSVPARLRIGGSHELQPKLTLMANYDQAFSEGFGITTTPRLSGGVEYRLVEWFPVRAGLSLGGRSRRSSAGFSLGPFSVFHMQTSLDLAAMTRGGFFPGVARGLAISAFWRLNLI